ncbi:MAG: hypothetical protein R3313_01075 [Candidatus Saccharimonadales bacterium]|nr:hypothetical protein [Candidatus Saccharimonadales bacterium]
MFKIKLNLKPALILTSSILLCLLLVANNAFAASLNTSGSFGSITESKGTSYTDTNGKSVVASNTPISFNISGTVNVTESLSSAFTIDITTNANCGFKPQGLGGPEFKYLSSRGFPSTAATTGIDVEVWPLYDSSYTGSRTCTISFSHNAASSSNSEVVTEYGSATIGSKSVTIVDAQSAPSDDDSSSNDDSSNSSNNSSSDGETNDDNKAPKAPVAKLLDGEGNEIVPEEGTVPAFEAGQGVTISGTTIPLGEITLFIYSEPQEAEVTADKDGNWSYTIEGLEAGEHRVEAEVTDPETGETSDREQVLAFQVVEALESTAQTQTISADIADENNDSTPIWIFGLPVVIVVGAGITWWWIKKRSSQKPENSESSSDGAQSPAIPDEEETTDINTQDS